MNDCGERAPGRLRRCLVAAGAALVVLFSLLGYRGLAAIMKNTSGGDFMSFWGPPRAMRALGLRTIYSDSARLQAALATERAGAESGDWRFADAARTWREGYLTLPSPLLYTLFGLFPPNDYRAALWTFRALSLLLYSGAVLWVIRRVGHRPLATVLLTLLFTSRYGPLAHDVGTGNVNQMQFGLLVLVLLLMDVGSRVTLFGSGFLLGFLVLFKPTIAPAIWLLVVLQAMRKPGRVLAAAGAGMAAGITLGLLAPLRLFDSLSCWTDWLRGMRSLLLGVPMFTMEKGNLSVPMEVWRRTGLDLSPWVCALLLGLATAALLSGARARDAGGRDGSFRETLWCVGTGCLVMLLSSRLVWSHYFLLALPATLLLIAPPSGAGMRLRGVGRCAAAVFAAGTVLFFSRGLGGSALMAFTFVSAAVLYLFMIAGFRGVRGRPGGRDRSLDPPLPRGG